MVAGIGSTLIEVLGAEAVRIHPAVSSVALARARMGWPAENVEVLRLGAGRGIDGLRRVLSPGRRILVLSADEKSPAEVATVCCDAGVPGARMSILGNLGAPDELRMDGDAAEFAGWGDAGEATGTGWPATIGRVPRLNIVAIECPGSTVGIGSGGGRASASERGPLDSRSEAAAWPRRAPEAENPPSHRVVRPVSGWLAPGLPDDAYEHDGQLTKRHVRAAALAALQPTPGELLWDLGAGAGSIGIEWARLHPANRVIAVERARERAERVARNAERLGVPRLEICIGSAFDLLADLPDPDAVFVGGGASAELLAACWERLPEHGRLVVHGVTLETETVLLDEHAARGGELVQLAVSIAKALGRYRGWAPARPVVQWSVTKAGS